MSLCSSLSKLPVFAAAIAASALLHAPIASAQAAAPATTILDTCQDDATGNWHYFGLAAVNPANATASVAVDFWVQNKLARDGDPNSFKAGSGNSLTALRSGSVQLMTYDAEAAPLTLGTLNGLAQVRVDGQAPLAVQTAALTSPLCGCKPTGCVRTQGYWGNKPGVVWPGGWYREMNFYGSGMSWQQILSTPPRGNAYIILAVQFISAVLNRNAGASAPQGVQDVMAATRDWLVSGTNLDTCKPGSCEQQKLWAAVLDVYNNGNYPNAPPHCSD